MITPWLDNEVFSDGEKLSVILRVMRNCFQSIPFTTAPSAIIPQLHVLARSDYSVRIRLQNHDTDPGLGLQFSDFK